MSRVARNPVIIPAGVEVNIAGDKLLVTGKKGTLQRRLHPRVKITQEDKLLRFAPLNIAADDAMAGTTRMLVHNMVVGVSDGFERKLLLVGVGFRAQVQDRQLNLTIGFSHPVNFAMPEGITIETPAATEIVVKGIDKQLVGQVAANIRALRPPEPYKGKGIKYANEVIILKEAKKK